VRAARTRHLIRTDLITEFVRIQFFWNVMLCLRWQVPDVWKNLSPSSSGSSSPRRTLENLRLLD